ncbi:MAG TPA: hypothetical protein VD694_05695 [Nitrososphaeraceae archaeon]|nr:hypothetical protein [Nitrososphaeraceae archaeon]
MAILVQEITRRQNKFWNKVIEYVTFTMAIAMVAFAAWQFWLNTSQLLPDNMKISR